MSKFASGGIIPALATGGDEVPVILDRGCFAGLMPGERIFDREGRDITPEPAGRQADYECGFCSRGQCARCRDPRCTCCSGNPEP